MPKADLPEELHEHLDASGYSHRNADIHKQLDKGCL